MKKAIYLDSRDQVYCCSVLNISKGKYIYFTPEFLASIERVA